MDFGTWYDALVKPAWTPPARTISLIWTILYPVIAVSFGFVIYQSGRGRLPWIVAFSFIINLLANLFFFPFFSGLRNLPLATVDILIVWGTLVWMIVAVWPHFRWVAFAQLPYLAWVSIATVLQVSILVKNG